MKKINLFLLSSIFLIILGCSSEQTKNLRPTTLALGKTNDLAIIADDDLWEGKIGDSLRFSLELPYIILPQPEPIFDLRHFDILDLEVEPLRKNLRTYLVIVDLSKKDSKLYRLLQADLGPTKMKKAHNDPNFNAAIGKDKWANGQIIIYLFGNNEKELLKAIKDQEILIRERVKKHDKKLLRGSALAGGVNQITKKLVADSFNLFLELPKGYKVAIHEDNFLWLRQDTRDINSNFMIYKLPYKNQDQFTKEGLKAIRDSLGKIYVTTEVEDTYMKINDIDLPFYVERINQNGLTALEGRGIWDVENDYMGGPFQCRLILDPSNKWLYFIDGFVYAPKKKKRFPMQKIEFLLDQVKIL